MQEFLRKSVILILRNNPNASRLANSENPNADRSAKKTTLRGGFLHENEGFDDLYKYSIKWFPTWFFRNWRVIIKSEVPAEGFEPPTLGLQIRRSIH